MKTVLEFARALQLASFEIRNMLDVPLEELMELVKVDAQAKIGHYQDGWKPLADSTLAEKTHLGFSPPDNPLLRTGEMRHSIEARAELTPYGGMGIVGSKDPVAKFQEMGTDRGIPPRPFLAQAMVEMDPSAERIFGDWLIKVLVKHLR